MTARATPDQTPVSVTSESKREASEMRNDPNTSSTPPHPVEEAVALTPERIAELRKIAEGLSKDERSALVYAETCIVDGAGLLEGARMNLDDHAALNGFEDEGLLTWGRIPSCLLGCHNFSKAPTHWVRFSPDAWALASMLRQRRALQIGPYAQSVFAEVDARARSALGGQHG